MQSVQHGSAISCARIASVTLLLSNGYSTYRGDWSRPTSPPSGAPAGAHPGSYTTSSAPAAATNEPGRKLPRYTPHKDEDRPLTGLGGAGRAGRRRTQQPDKPSPLIRHMLRTAARRVRSSLAAACTRFSTKTKSCKKHSESENLRHGSRNPNPNVT